MAVASPTAALRVAVVGARRVRNGTGPFLARHAHQAGAEVCAVIGTSADTAEEARAQLAARRIAVRAETRLERVLEQEPLDVLFVASPSGTHGPWLEAALRARLHVLCEKPLLAGPSDGAAALRQGAAEAARLAAAFAARGLVLAETCQWPRTLPVYWILHGSRDYTALRRFEMRLSPSQPGVPGWIDSLSHPLSLLQALVPGPARVQEPRFGTLPGGERVEFRYTAAGRSLECEVVLIPSAQAPRTAWYALDGRRVQRVLGPGYEFRFETGAPQDRSWRANDPMKIAVRAFLAHAAAARAGEAVPADPELVARQELFAEILAAHPGLR